MTRQSLSIAKNHDKRFQNVAPPQKKGSSPPRVFLRHAHPRGHDPPRHHRHQVQAIPRARVRLRGEADLNADKLAEVYSSVPHTQVLNVWSERGRRAVVLPPFGRV